METQEHMNIGIGTKESVSLKEATVKIMDATIVKVGEKLNEKAQCSVKHPDKEEVISISAVKWEKNGKLEVTGLWFNKDEDGNIRKGSALAVFLESVGAETLADLNGKEADTAIDDKGYLCFKAY